MESKSSHSTFQEEKSDDHTENLVHKLDQLRKDIQAARVANVQDKIEKNRKKLETDMSQLVSATSSYAGMKGVSSAISARIVDPLWVYSGFFQGTGDRDNGNGQEGIHWTNTKLPSAEKIPPYTTWIFLDRNQKMTEDQSVVGRRRIYYAKHDGEALICSDSEEEVAEPEEEKHEFSEGEDRFIWTVFQEDGLADYVVDLVSQIIGVSAMDIRERCSILDEKFAREQDLKNSRDPRYARGITLEKSLSAAMDSYDNLFCRRCLVIVFDCRLHGCSQTLIYPNEKQSEWSECEDDRKPCGDQCCLRQTVEDFSERGIINREERGKRLVILDDRIPGDIDGCTELVESQRSMHEKGTLVPSESACDPEIHPQTQHTDASYIAKGIEDIKKLKRKASCQSYIEAATSTQVAFDSDDSSCKKQKELFVADVISGSEGVPSVGFGSRNKSTTDMINDASPAESTLNEVFCTVAEKDTGAEHLEVTNVLERDHSISPLKCANATEVDTGLEHKIVDDLPRRSQSMSPVKSSEWRTLEKELYLKGVEIFGKNSCLIARNLLSGLKTCIEVSKYMSDSGTTMTNRSLTRSSSSEDNGKTDADYMETARTRVFRRKGKARRFKYSWKSSGHPSSMRKRIADEKDELCKQYTPCGCQPTCGTQCPCLKNGTCCEKYCGCSKSCKNRFRGCHCAKSQCRSRLCPCFAAGRECDPDVCRNCWVSCGDGSLGEPPKRGDGQCGNMRLLLRQQQRIVLAESDVAGWGAFLKNSVNKNDFLGEYTGELISHREADKRGKIYDRANSSFLFDLNDQASFPSSECFVLDANRKGDKLKFANHSLNPNCYARIMLVAGDHRVGIFAKEHIDAWEELFYDYQYGPNQAPVWARKPEKEYSSSASQGRAKKHQSN
ncbi:Histone-lysine N-methyltransferase EZ1 [Linum perenne]